MAIVKTTIVALLLAGGIAAAGESTAPAATTDATAKPAKAKTCERVSGTRIQPSPATGCRRTVEPMRTYTQEDLRRTGEIDINQALRELDPIFH